MFNRYREKYSPALTTKKMQGPTKIRYHLTEIKQSQIRIKTSSAGVNIERKESSTSAKGNVDWVIILGNYEYFSKTDNWASKQSTTSAPWYIPNSEKYISERNLYSFI